MGAILVTGGCGYIGGVATELLASKGFEVIVIDNLSTGHKDILPKDVSFYNSNIGDIEALKNIFSKHKITAVLHFAGAALVGESMINPKKYFDNNFIQAQNLLNIMKLFNVNKFIFSSTCAVYGIPNPDDIPIKETTQTKPINPYGESKLLFEKLLDWHKEKYGLKYIALRYFNVAGSSKNIGERHKPETHLIPLVIKAAKNKNYELKIYGKNYLTKDGTAIRDYVHVMDLIDAHLLALEVLISNKNYSNIYNVGYGRGYSVMEIVNAAKDILKSEIKYIITERRLGDPPVLISDSSKIKKELNWTPKHDNLTDIMTSASKFVS